MEIPNYSLGQPARRTGLGGFSMKATVIVGTGFTVFLFLQIAGLRPAGFTVLGVSVVAAAVVSVLVRGRTIAELGQIVMQARRRRRRGEDWYVSGPLSRIPGGRHQLPGLLARTDVVEGVDSLGQVFAVVVDRPRREATVVFDCQLTGQTAMTQGERNGLTASWGRFLAGLSLSGDVEAVAVTVAVRPGSGELVRREVESIVDPQAPWLARAVMDEAAEALSTGLPEIRSHVAVTVKVDGEGISEDAFVGNLATRVPGWQEGLVWAGMLASPMTEEELVARVHSMFDPASESDFEEMEVAGVSHGMGWKDAGPSVAVVRPECYVHDGVWSVSWEMVDAPRSTFEDHVLTGLVAPHDRVVRKRVTLVYRPFSAGQGASRVEAEHRDALVAANSGKKIRSAAAEMRLEHTEAARRAQARGAQLGRYSLFVTASTDDASQIRRLRHDVEQLAAGSSVRLRVARHQQDTDFVVSLGVGQVPWPKSTVAKVAVA